MSAQRLEISLAKEVLQVDTDEYVRDQGHFSLLSTAAPLFPFIVIHA